MKWVEFSKRRTSFNTYFNMWSVNPWMTVPVSMPKSHVAPSRCRKKACSRRQYIGARIFAVRLRMWWSTCKSRLLVQKSTYLSFVMCKMLLFPDVFSILLFLLQLRCPKFPLKIAIQWLPDVAYLSCHKFQNLFNWTFLTASVGSSFATAQSPDPFRASNCNDACAYH